MKMGMKDANLRKVTKTMAKAIRQCPECELSVIGKNINEDFYRFECFPCDEEWYEDIKYYIPEEIRDSEFQEATI